ncbi:glutathione peroxidase [Serratia entomophila]|uniref:glutathione peroxidase n=1 Tax=Serratia entomophila TaxID=42906 RepID=UPI00217C91D8|nr:glutathione peroxidase [Serratia entomophila]CAI0855405.1 Glutathione peroxidase homolog BsaA [Serratia entomophila]CAI1524868.1 Glutathione peroxidase homolog BsaA [Serratia entomophila]CAI1573215.1 Glutathione peroxidase homolog BsaA [Serratia entomophila]CAI1703517.1 Glutathione peroxidase homolog BsaA [Serratia entomophila]CAI1806435.1 Glutathione peroxidase homolog BsaA [Serratia entomophila]
MSQSIYSLPLQTIENQNTTLDAYQGSVLLVVNVASECGLTKQYEGLEALYETYRSQGFEVLGFPSNEFLGQEPGSNEEILAFCRGTFGVQFPMFAKIEVNGENRHPLYRALIAAQPHAQAPEGSEFLARMTSKGRAPKQPGDILWNFEKFLIARDGTVNQRFSPDTTPEDPTLVAAVKQALAG